MSSYRAVSRYSERSFPGPRSFGHGNPLLHFHSQLACLNHRGHLHPGCAWYEEKMWVLTWLAHYVLNKISIVQRNQTLHAEREVMMIAIPIMRGRVAPVLNWCSRTMIFPVRPRGGKRSGTLDAGVKSIGTVAAIAGAWGADVDLRGLEFGFAKLRSWIGIEDNSRCGRRYCRSHQSLSGKMSGPAGILAARLPGAQALPTRVKEREMYGNNYK